MASIRLTLANFISPRQTHGDTQGGDNLLARNAGFGDRIIYIDGHDIQDKKPPPVGRGCHAPPFPFGLH